MLAEWLTGLWWLPMQFMLDGCAGNAVYAVWLSLLDMIAVYAGMLVSNFGYAGSLFCI
jgi:hypothetical protein